MSKNWILLTGLLFLGAVGTSQAHPLDSPDIVYIDGLPCNRACQSYLAWSWRKTSPAIQHATPAELPPEQSPPAKAASEKAAPHPTKRAASRATAVHRENPKPAKPRVAKQAAPMPPAQVATLPPAAEAAVEPAPGHAAALPSADGVAAASKAMTVQEQVAAATALAEQVTATSAPNKEATEASIFAEAAGPGDTTASVATDITDRRIALVLVRPEIKSVSDLAGRDVAIDDQQSASSASIRAAIASAGAAEVQLNDNNVKPVDRLVGGEVPAAVVALVSAEAAEWFPKIPGYRIFRIPLSAGALKTRL